ncbi:MAG TPA: T9SS type A sorting domain-containing protein, partial [Flavisolibacter sp.]
KIQTSDGGYFFTVSTSSADGDVTGYHKPRNGTTFDIWVAKLDGAGNIRKPGTVQQPVTATEAELPSGIRAFPNPFTQQTSISFTAPADGRTIIDLYTVDGKRVRSILDREIRGGQVYTVSFNDAALPKGVYFYRLCNGKNALSGRLVKN